MSDKETTMVERVARRIWNIRREEEDRCDMELEDMGEDHSVWAEARAAIREMRVPTEAMVEATEEVVVGYDDFACGDGTLYMHHGDAESAWQAMIDAALNEKDHA